jgi:hypothetical protein
MLNELLDKLIEWKLWSEEKNPEKWGSFCRNNSSSFHVCLVANSYPSMLYFSVTQTMRGYCGKCVVTHICSMGIRYVANFMQYFALCYIIYITQKGLLLFSTKIFFCSYYVWKAIFKKQNGQTKFISLV